jgi:hypothetical protein
MMIPVCPISAILFLVLIVVVIKIAVGLLRHGVIRAVLLGFVLLMVLSVAALVAAIGHGVRYMNSGGTVNIQQQGNSVKVSPFGVEVRSQSGESVKVSPLGVQVNTRTHVAAEGLRADPDALSRTVEAYEQGHASVQTSPLGKVPAIQLDEPAGLLAEVEALQPPTAPTASPASAQPPLLADHFDPDVYQSEGAAVRGLTGQMAKILDSVTAGKKDPSREQGPSPIVIKGMISPSLLQEMQGILAKEFPSAWVYWSKGSTRVDGNTVILYACREPEGSVDGTVTGDNTEGAPHVLRMDATGTEGKISRSTRFLDKPWVDDFSLFASQSKGRNWIKALSREPAISTAEAEQKAIDDAVSQLEPRVRDRMTGDARGAESSGIQRQIRANLESSGMIADRFVQRFERSYAELWQVGLLIDASSKKIAGLAEKCDRLLVVKQRTHRQTALSIAGVVALVCVVYIFLNSVTKGYFVWSLRAAAIAIIAGGVFLVLLLSHNEPAIDGFLR